jgi:uncharacterized integral membrane protein
MTLPADNRPPGTPAGDLPPRAPEPGWSAHRSPTTPEPTPLPDDPAAFRDPVPIPTTEVEPIPTPGSTTHGPGTPPGEVAAPDEPSGRGRTVVKPRMFTRISAAWLGVWAGLLVVVLLIVFIGQNTADVRIRFLWLDGLIPTALALLIAGVGGAIIAMAVAAARIVQLRRLVRRRRD